MATYVLNSFVEITGTSFSLEANFPPDGKHHIAFQSLDGYPITLIAQGGSTAWRVGSEMPIPDSGSFPGYNSGVYNMASKDGSKFTLLVSLLCG